MRFLRERCTNFIDGAFSWNNWNIRPIWNRYCPLLKIVQSRFLLTDFYISGAISWISWISLAGGFAPLREILYLNCRLIWEKTLLLWKVWKIQARHWDVQVELEKLIKMLEGNIHLWELKLAGTTKMSRDVGTLRWLDVEHYWALLKCFSIPVLDSWRGLYPTCCENSSRQWTIKSWSDTHCSALQCTVTEN